MWVCYFDARHSKSILDHNDTVALKEQLESFSYRVGYYEPDGKFHQWDCFHHKWEAEAMVHYLNGGCTKRCNNE